MSGWLAIGLFVTGLIVVALFVLLFDVMRGDVGGGRHTMARARRLLVVSTDADTSAGAERWMTEQHVERPDLQFLVLTGDGEDDPQLFADIESAVERDRPDAIVFARHDEESHTTLARLYGELKEHATVPVDAIYVKKGAGV